MLCELYTSIVCTLIKREAHLNERKVSQKEQLIFVYRLILGSYLISSIVFFILFLLHEWDEVFEIQLCLPIRIQGERWTPMLSRHEVYVERRLHFSFFLFFYSSLSSNTLTILSYSQSKTWLVPFSFVSLCFTSFSIYVCVYVARVERVQFQ